MRIREYADTGVSWYGDAGTQRCAYLGRRKEFGRITGSQDEQKTQDPHDSQDDQQLQNPQDTTGHHKKPMHLTLTQCDLPLLNIAHPYSMRFTLT